MRRLDPARELHCSDVLVTLSPKVFDCLTYPIAHRDRAVGRDELIAAVWGRVDVTDTLLGQTVLKARRAIGGASPASAGSRRRCWHSPVQPKHHRR
ncbi:MAG: transcriptional regulator [Lysobacterales bacterium]